LAKVHPGREYPDFCVLSHIPVFEGQAAEFVDDDGILAE
jgi:hypothetical protein